MISGTYEKIDIDMASNEARFQNSEYAQVIFQNIAETYPTEDHIECKYSVTPNLTPSSHDWVGLYKVGWSSPKEYTYFEWAPLPENDHASVLFPAHKLPAEDGEFYQFCYVTASGQVRGASIPFQFKAPNADDFVEVMDDDNDMMIIKHRSIVLEEDLQRAQQIKLGLLKDKSLLVVERDSLICKLIDLEKALKQEQHQTTDLKSKLKECCDKTETLQGEVREITALNESLKEKIAARNQEMQEVMKRLEDNECYISSLQDKIKSLVQEKDTLTGRNKVLEEEKELFKSHFSTSEEAIVAYQREVEGLKKQVADMDHTDSLTRSRIDELEKAIGDKQRSLQSQVSITKKTEGVVADLQEQLKNTEERLSAAEECKKLINDELTNVQQAHDNMAGELEKCKSDEHYLKSQVTQMEQTLAEKEEDWLKQNEDIQKTCEEVTMAKEEKSEELAQALLELENFQTQKKEEEGPLYALKVAHGHLKDKCAKLQSQLDQQQKHFDDVITKQKKWCESRVEQELRAEIDELKQRLEMAASEYAAKYRECRALQKKISKHANKEPTTVVEGISAVEISETQKSETTDEGAGEATHDQSVQMEASVADLSNSELQAQLGDLARELETRHTKKELYKQKFTDEREKNNFLQKHYHEELKKKDEIIEKKDEIIDGLKRELSELRKLQSQDSTSLQNVIDHQNGEIARLRGVDCNQDTMQKERVAGDHTIVMEPPQMYTNPYMMEVPPLKYGNPYIKDDDEENTAAMASALARPLAPLPAPLMPHVLPSAKLAQVKMLIVDPQSSTDMMAVVEPPVEPPAPLMVELQGAEGGAEATPNAPPAEDEEKFQDAPSEPYTECPICRLEFPPHTNEAVITEHVDQHLEKDKACPMCGLMFKTDKQDAFEQHVQGHFDTE
eukprot:GHVU01184295.1.p1 GENE.GHVU01184295.1~~GHVU01184295.1.p1  ORF type:complete len:903 (+),score=196.98 GHVU01184295.1:43-2751(+)